LETECPTRQIQRTQNAAPLISSVSHLTRLLFLLFAILNFNTFLV
jgi:hypothetical protein